MSLGIQVLASISKGSIAVFLILSIPCYLSIRIRFLPTVTEISLQLYCGLLLGNNQFHFGARKVPICFSFLLIELQSLLVYTVSVSSTLYGNESNRLVPY